MLSIIIKEIDEHGALSYWEIYKILKNKYKINCDKSNIRYHLEKLRRNGFIGKKGSKYHLKAPTICIDGTVLFTNPPAVVNCPYFKSDGCKNCSFGEECCKLFKALPEELQNFYRKILKREEGK